MPSYTDLQTYRKCPRLYGFSLLGYKPIKTPEPLMTGQLVHTAIAAYFRNMDWKEAMLAMANEVTEKLKVLESNLDKHSKALKELGSSSIRAEGLAKRYIEHWANDYKAPLVETWVELGSVRGIVDLIAYYAEQRVIVDYKTSRSPDMRWYDISGQVDLYAYVLKEQGTDIALVIYDVISEEGIFRHARPPRLEAGEKLCRWWIADLDKLLCQQCLDEPHFNYDCPQRCQFWIPCWLLETADWAACEDYLKANYIKEE